MRKIFSFAFLISSLSFAQITETGTKVGIGTTSPAETLHVNGTTTITGDIGTPTINHWSTGAHTLELQNGDAGDVVLSFHRGGYTNAAIKHSSLGGLIFSGSGAYDQNHMFLKSNGYLGLGTTAPSSSLHINSPLKNIDNFIVTTSPIGEVPDNIFVIANANGSGVAKMKNRFGSQHILLNTEGNSYLNGGNVGIGTTSPSSLLDIANISASIGESVDLNFTLKGAKSSIRSTLMHSTNNVSSLSFFTDPNFGPAQERMRITENGHIGIGTTSPTSHFSAGSLINLKSIGNSEIVLDHSDGGSSSDIGILSFERNGDHLAHIRAAHDNSTTAAFISFHTQLSGGSFSNINSNERVRITNTGRVGIGTSTPGAKLDVEGGNLFIGAEASTNGTRRELRVYGYDAGTKFYGSMHSNYDDNKRTYDISTNNQVQQIKIDASAHNNANIILNPGLSAYVGIGTTTPDSKLTVAGNIHAREVKVTVNAGADFVFEDNYKLPSLNQLETFIKTHKHLPEIASEKEMQENGLLLAEMNIKLLQKIEELTLYTINQEKRIENLEEKNEKLIDLVEKLINSEIEE